VLAHVALARACQAARDGAGYQKHITALARLEGSPVAEWARGRVAGLAPAPA
jgi:hypothetical protein